MSDPAPTADAKVDLRGKARRRPGRFIAIAPGPELPDQRDRAGAQRGMALALLGGGAFWAAVAAAAIYFLRR